MISTLSKFKFFLQPREARKSILVLHIANFKQLGPKPSRNIQSQIQIYDQVQNQHTNILEPSNHFEIIYLKVKP